MRNYSKVLLFIILLILMVVGIIAFLPSTYPTPANTEILETTQARQHIVFKPPNFPLIILPYNPSLVVITAKETTTVTTTVATTVKREPKISRTIQTTSVATTTTTIPIQTTEKPPRYGFTEDDIYLMTVVLCGSKNKAGDGEYDIDYGNQDRNDQISLVLGVIMNRVCSDLYPDTVSEVIWQRGQFVVMKRWSKDALPEVSEDSLYIVRQWCEAYDNYDPSVQTIPEDHLGFYGDGYENHSYPLN